MNATRRRFIRNAAGFFCAPAIVKADNIMKIWVPPERTIITEFKFYDDFTVAQSVEIAIEPPVDWRFAIIYNEHARKIIDIKDWAK